MMHVKLMLIGTALLGLGMLLLLIFLILLARRISYYSQDHKVRRAPAGVSYIAIFFAVVLLALSWVFFRAANDFKGFRVYKPSARICLVDVSRTGDPIKSMRVILYTLKGDSLKENPEFYLSGNSWWLKGQVVQLSGYIQNLFPSPLAYKLSEMHGDFVGQENTGTDRAVLVHQALDGGTINLNSYVKTVNFFKGTMKAMEFKTQPILVSQRERYWLSISDSGNVAIEPVEVLQKN